MKHRYLLLPLLLVPSLAVAAKQQYVSLASAEKSYYALAFSYAMSTVETGNAYEWKTYSSNGAIRPETPFISRSGAECREFTETYTIQGVQGENVGVGCKRKGDDGWCRLGLKQALTCAMEKRNSFDIDIPVVHLNAPDVNINMPSVGGSPSTPSGAGQNIGGGSAPSRGATGEDVADTVTGAAGSVAGPATGGMIRWFNDTFR
jgi:hypothetical protein